MMCIVVFVSWLIFLDSLGRTDKTFLINLILGLKVRIATAFSGIAATLSNWMCC